MFFAQVNIKVTTDPQSQNFPNFRIVWRGCNIWRHIISIISVSIDQNFKKQQKALETRSFANVSSDFT